MHAMPMTMTVARTPMRMRRMGELEDDVLGEGGEDIGGEGDGGDGVNDRVTATAS